MLNRGELDICLVWNRSRLTENALKYTRVRCSTPRPGPRLNCSRSRLSDAQP
jgi:hypothetical protein